MSGPAGPYSPVVRAGEWVIVSGQLGVVDGRVVEGGVTAEVRQAVSNLARLLAGAGLGLHDVVKTTVFLIDLADYAEMNGAYLDAFGGHRPARTAVAVSGIPLGARVEIEAWAHASPPGT